MRLLTLFVATGTALMTEGVNAQGTLIPPPRFDASSSTGVDFHTGAFRHEVLDLKIGQGNFPQALELRRTYLSSLDQVISQRSGTPTQGWSNNLNGYVGNTLVRTPGYALAPNDMGSQYYLYSVIFGARSAGFIGGTPWPAIGGFEGSYEAIDWNGTHLEFAGAQTTGNYKFLEADGTEILFNASSAPGYAALSVAELKSPDGTILTFTYDNDGLRSVFSNRGYALLFEYAAVAGGKGRVKACSVNTGRTHVAPTSLCPSGAASVTYGYSALSGGGYTGPGLTTVTDAESGVTTYAYSASGHLSCVKEPGQASCKVSNTYGTCEPDFNPDEPYQEPYGFRWQEPVRTQTLATGEVISYSFPATQMCPVAASSRQVTETVGGTSRVIHTSETGVPTQVFDGLGRKTTYFYTGPSTVYGNFNATPAGVQLPEGNGTQLQLDSRGNVLGTTFSAKTGSSAASISNSASYPSSCTNRKTCNKPESITDNRGAKTHYTYAPEHGGITSVMQPAPQPGSARPLQLTSWTQKAAYLKSSGGGMLAASSPVWVIASETVCQTVPGSTSPVCDANARQQVTINEYGADGTADNLLVRGKLVLVGNASRRTCFSYDERGNTVSTTTANANLTSCP